MITSFPAIAGNLWAVDDFDTVKSVGEDTPDFSLAAAGWTCHDEIPAAFVDVVVHQHGCGTFGVLLTIHPVIEIVINFAWRPVMLPILGRLRFHKRDFISRSGVFPSAVVQQGSFDGRDIPRRLTVIGVDRSIRQNSADIFPVFMYLLP